MYVVVYIIVFSSHSLYSRLVQTGVISGTMPSPSISQKNTWNQTTQHFCMVKYLENKGGAGCGLQHHSHAKALTVHATNGCNFGSATIGSSLARIESRTCREGSSPVPPTTYNMLKLSGCIANSSKVIIIIISYHFHHKLYYKLDSARLNRCQIGRSAPVSPGRGHLAMPWEVVVLFYSRT